MVGVAAVMLHVRLGLGNQGRIQGKFDFAHNIAVDSEGSVYVVEIKNWRVQKFAK